MSSLDFIDGQVTLSVDGARLGWYAAEYQTPPVSKPPGYATASLFYSAEIVDKALMGKTLEDDAETALDGLSVDNITEIMLALKLHKEFYGIAQGGLAEVAHHIEDAEVLMRLSNVPGSEHAALQVVVNGVKRHADSSEALARLGKHLFYSAVKMPELSFLVGALSDLQAWDEEFERAIGGINGPSEGLTLPGSQAFKDVKCIISDLDIEFPF